MDAAANWEMKGDLAKAGACLANAGACMDRTFNVPSNGVPGFLAGIAYKAQ